MSDQQPPAPSILALPPLPPVPMKITSHWDRQAGQPLSAFELEIEGTYLKSTMRFDGTVPPPPRDLIAAIVKDPLYDRLRARILADQSDGIKHYHALANELAEIGHRCAVLKAKHGALTAQRELTEIEAKPGFAARCAKLDSQIAEVTHEHEAAVAESKIAAPRVRQAFDALTVPHGDYAAAERQTLIQTLQQAREAAHAEVAAAVEKVVSEQLGRVVALDQLIAAVPDEGDIRACCAAIARHPPADDSDGRPDASPEPDGDTPAEAVQPRAELLEPAAATS